jgi:hypothetical protein
MREVSFCPLKLHPSMPSRRTREKLEDRVNRETTSEVNLRPRSIAPVAKPCQNPLRWSPWG